MSTKEKYIDSKYEIKVLKGLCYKAMGGLDIFKLDFDDNNNIKSLINVGSPINSASNDFGIIFENIKERGFLSSDRVGSKAIDIYHFSLPIE